MDDIRADDIAPECGRRDSCGAPKPTWQLYPRSGNLGGREGSKILWDVSATLSQARGHTGNMSAPAGAVGVMPSARLDVSGTRGARVPRGIRGGFVSPTGISSRPRANSSSATRRHRRGLVVVNYHGDRQQYSGKDKDYGAADAPWKKKVKWRLDDEEDEENQRRGVASNGWKPPPPPVDTNQGSTMNFVKPKRAADKPYTPPPKPPGSTYQSPPKPTVNAWEVASQIGRHGVRPSWLDETSLRLLKNAGVDLRQADFDEMEARADEYHMEEAARNEARLNSSKEASFSWDDGSSSSSTTSSSGSSDRPYRVTDEFPLNGAQVADSDETYAEWVKSFSFQVAVRLRAHGVHPSALDASARYVLEMAGVSPDWVEYYYATQDAQETDVEFGNSTSSSSYSADDSWERWDQRATDRSSWATADLERDRADTHGTRASASENERVVLSALEPSQFDTRSPARVDGMTVLDEYPSDFGLLEVMRVDDDHADDTFAGATLLMRASNRNAVLSEYRPGNSPATGGIFDLFAMLPPLLVGQPGWHPIGILGLGAGTCARELALFYPDETRRMVGWELDPSILHLGRKWFGMDELERSGRLTAQCGDAFEELRRVNQGGGKCAGIIVDVFDEDSAVLPQLTRIETWEEIAQSLAPGGRVIANLSTGRGKSANMQAAVAAAEAAIVTCGGGQGSLWRGGAHGIWNEVVLTGPHPTIQCWADGHLPMRLAEYTDAWVPISAPTGAKQGWM